MRYSLGVVFLSTIVIAPQFEAVQTELFAAGNTLTNAWADFDNDGDLDLFVGFNGAPNRLYQNDGGTFRDVAADAGVADARATRAAAWGDYDADGDADLLVGFAPGTTSLLKLYRNQGGKFTDVSADAGVSVDSGAVRQPSFLDVDGDLDLFVGFNGAPNRLYQNDGGTFRDVAADAGVADARATRAAAWGDYDADGDADLLVGFAPGTTSLLKLYQNLSLIHI